MEIKWDDPSCKVTEHFIVKDSIWLPRYGRLATEADGLTLEKKANLILLFNQMEVVRAFLGNKPIVVNVTYRSKAYNKLVDGATNSAHLFGKAVDFFVPGMTCDDVRKLIVPKLEEWKLRCENLPRSTWTHIDSRSPGAGGRYFKP